MLWDIFCKVIDNYGDIVLDVPRCAAVLPALLGDAVRRPEHPKYLLVAHAPTERPRFIHAPVVAHRVARTAAAFGTGHGARD